MRMPRVRVLAALTLLAALVLVGVRPEPAAAAFTTVTTTADTYSNNGAPTSNFGTSCCLAVGGTHYIAYLRFVIPANATAATLTLAVSSQTFAGSTSTFKVTTASDSWGESTLTYNNRPALGPDTLGTFTGVGVNGTISTAITGISAYSGQEITLALSSLTGTDDLWLWAKEHNVIGKTPTLSVTTDDSGGGGTGPNVGILGDSIAQGCCSDTTGTVAAPFWRVTAQILGWADPTAVDAVGGSGYVTAGSGQPYTVRIGSFLDANPTLDALVVEGGGNDGGVSETTEEAAAGQVFDTIQAHNPLLKVYVLGPYSKDADPTYAATQRTAISNAAAAHGYPFIDQIAEGWMHDAQADLHYSDNFHPDEAGHQLLGVRFAGDLAILACHTGCLP